jgi:Flp pilus assembly pilin Flp
MRHQDNLDSIATTSSLARFVARLRQDQRGASFVEYVIVVGLVAIVCIFAFGKFGSAINKKVEDQTKSIETMKSP